VVAADHQEFGTHQLTVADPGFLFENCPTSMPVLESHGDRVEPSENLTVMGTTKHCPVAAASYKHCHGVQFHPEVTETEHGPEMFHNFCFNICGATDTFPAEDVAQAKTAELREQIGDKKVVVALSK